MNKKITEYTEVELKALKADIYEEQSRLNQNLNIINTELTLRKETKEVTPTEEAKE
jgi:hypothetical protein